MGDRVFLKDVQQYKEEKHAGLEIIQYQGAVMKATVAHVGVDCRHHTPGQTVIFQSPVGIEIGFEGVKYLVLRESDIMFSIS